jgi:hypothetical protein
MYSVANGIDNLHSTMMVKHIPFNSLDPEYSPDEHAPLAVPWQRILAYRQFEQSLLSLPTPLLLQCKTSRRASAVYTAFKAVNQKIPKEEIHKFAENNGKTAITL